MQNKDDLRIMENGGGKNNLVKFVLQTQQNKEDPLIILLWNTCTSYQECICYLGHPLYRVIIVIGPPLGTILQKVLKRGILLSFIQI